jgi:2-C-methyl-D-erythritol 4-phosphate cytidylyltransferase
MWEWSLRAFEAAESVARFVVAVPPGSPDDLVGETEELTVVEGGATRSESVAAGLEAVETEFVAVHDAARPLVTAELIDAVVARLEEHPEADCVLAAAAITDTVKRAVEARPSGGDEFPEVCFPVSETVSRGHLWAAQTPQAFRAERLREALAADPGRIAAATDDAMLIEQAGGRVLIHPASAANLKVTTPLDLRVAELLLGSS